jgi:inner membrane protein
MDVVTQAIFGAAAGQAVAGRRLPRSAWLIGAMAGYLPDADIFIRFENDTLSTWLIHRHFTHGIGFWPIGAVLVMVVWAACVLMWQRGRAMQQAGAGGQAGDLRRRGWWGMGLAAAMAGIMTHGVLDACTSFGTMIYWPISDARVSWDLVAIIDPLVSLPMLALVIASVVLGWRGRVNRAVSEAAAHSRGVRYAGVRRIAVAALVWAGMYIGGFASLQKARAIEVQRQMAQQRGDMIERGRVLMAPLQNYVFRSVYVSGGYVVADMIRVPWWPGGMVQVLRANHPKTKLIDDREIEAMQIDDAVKRDARRFAAFTQGYAVMHPEVSMALADARYGLGVESMASLWYLDLQPSRSDAATMEVTRLVREMGRINRQRDELIGILLGRDRRLELLPR